VSEVIGRRHLPATIEELSAAWFTEALSERCPGVSVLDARVVDLIRGASTKIRFELTYRPASGPVPPTRMIAKGGFGDHSRLRAEMHLHEALAYRNFVPTLSVRTPDCYVAHVDEQGRAMVLIEDLALSNSRFLTLQEPIGYEQAEAFLAVLAGIHARWWNAPELADPNVFGERALISVGVGYLLDNTERLLAPEMFAEYMVLPRGAATPRVLRDGERLRAGLRRLAEFQRRAGVTVNHGDALLGNLYLTAQGEPGFLDWQPNKGPWSQDISYFLTSALDLPDRRRWETALLAYYLNTLRELGVKAPRFDEAWLLYRRNVLWGFYAWLLNSNAFQSEANNTANCVRFATAMIDHDVYGLIESWDCALARA